MERLTECPACGTEANSPKVVLRAKALSSTDEIHCVLTRCCECRHVFMNPQPSPVELAPFYDDHYHVFADRPKTPKEIDELIARRFDGVRLNHASFAEGKAFLDVGCGLGDMVAAMQRLGMDARGIDPSPNAVRIARAVGRAVELGDLRDRAFDAGQFHSISMYHSLEHTPDPFAVLRECARILAPEGELMVAVPNIDSLNARIFGRQWSHLSLPHHLQHFTAQTLQRVAQRAGLRCTGVITESLLWSVESELCRWARHNMLIPYRISDSLHVFRPIALLLTRRGERAGRGDAVVAHFELADT